MGRTGYIVNFAEWNNHFHYSTTDSGISSEKFCTFIKKFPKITERIPGIIRIIAILLTTIYKINSNLNPLQSVNENLDKNRIILITSSLTIFPVTYLFFSFLTEHLRGQMAFIIALIIYWIIISIFSIIIVSKNFSQYRFLIKPKHHPKEILSYNIFSFTPVAGVFFVAFIPNMVDLSFANALIIIIISVINGTVEEFYWRGLYLKIFRNNDFVGIILSSILFASWHISLWILNDITYHGGFPALVGGAFFMGLIWSYVTRKTGNIFYCTIAHILVNIFAFTGLFVNNF